MPNAAPHPCSFKGCGLLVYGEKSRCPQHDRGAFGRDIPFKRVTGRPLQRLRWDLYVKQECHCALCARVVEFGPKTFIRDHIIPLAEGQVDRNSNDGCQGLCKRCSDTKTQAEAKRGMERMR